MHYYPHHIGDFIRDTSRLSDSQSMAYLRLLWTYYDTETPLPNTPARLAFQIGASASDVELILDHFFVLDGDVWRHARVEKEIGHFRSKAQKASASAKARWSNAKAMRPHNYSNADDSVSDANQEPRTKNQDKEVSKDTLSPAKLPTCPHLAIIDLFAKHLPELPQPKAELWDGARAKNLTARWKWVLTEKRRSTGTPHAGNKEEALAWFDRFFGYVAQSDFLTGRDGKWQNCDLAWLTKADNFAKVLQGNYENKS